MAFTPRTPGIGLVFCDLPRNEVWGPNFCGHNLPGNGDVIGPTYGHHKTLEVDVP